MMNNRKNTLSEKRDPLWTAPFVLVCILNFLQFAGMWMLPAMLPVYIHELGAPSYMLGWIMGITAIATIISRPAAGIAIKKYGRRGVFTVGTIGMILTLASFALLPLVGAILAIRFVQGLAWGLSNTACATIGSDNIPKARYGEGFGYFTLASSVAMIISPALALAVFYAFGGAAASLLSAGIFGLVLLVSCFITYHKIEKTPEPSAKTPFRLISFIKNELFVREAVFAGVMMMFVSTSYGLVQTFLPVAMESRGVEGIGLFFIVMAVAAVISRPLVGRWADRRNYFEPAVAIFACLAVSLAITAWAQSTEALLAAAVLNGIGYSSGFSLFLSFAPLKASAERKSSAIATVMVGFDIGAGLSSVVLGGLVASQGFEIVFFGGAVIAVVGIVMAYVNRQSLA